MNILINYLGTDGAGRLIALSLARAFKKNGNKIYAVLSKGTDNNEKWIEEFGKNNICEVENYSNGNKKDFIIKTVKFASCGKRIISEYFRKIDIDVSLRVMYHHWSYIVDKAVNARSIVTICHNPIMHSDEKKYFRKLYRMHILQSDKVIVLTKSYTDLVEKEFGFSQKDILYVPLGRIDEYTKYLPKEINPPYNQDNINFLFFGLIRSYKGLHVLLSAYRKICNLRSNVTLRIVGSGNMEEYRQEISECSNISIVNRYIDDDEVSGYFAGPNVVVVLPYIDASQSGIIQVAYEYENVVIASNTDALKEQLGDGTIGLFFEKGNDNDLVKQMLRVIDGSNIIKIQKELMKQQRVRLDWNIIAKQIEEFI